MGDAPNELEVLEARREILQLEIALAQERRAAAEAEQKGKKAADEGGEPTLDYVVPASYPDARHAESLPTTGIPRRGKPTLLSLPSNPVLQHLEAESVKQGHASSHAASGFYGGAGSYRRIFPPGYGGRVKDVHGFPHRETAVQNGGGPLRVESRSKRLHETAGASGGASEAATTRRAARRHVATRLHAGCRWR